MPSGRFFIVPGMPCIVHATASSAVRSVNVYRHGESLLSINMRYAQGLGHLPQTYPAASIQSLINAVPGSNACCSPAVVTGRGLDTDWYWKVQTGVSLRRADRARTAGGLTANLRSRSASRQTRSKGDVTCEAQYNVISNDTCCCNVEQESRAMCANNGGCRVPQTAIIML